MKSKIMLFCIRVSLGSWRYLSDAGHNWNFSAHAIITVHPVIVMPCQLQKLGLKLNTSRVRQSIQPGIEPSLARSHKDITSLDEKQGKKLKAAS